MRPQPWLQAGKYLGALVSDLPKRNGWTIAQRAGHRTPGRTQRLLASWPVRGRQRCYLSGDSGCVATEFRRSRQSSPPPGTESMM